MIAPYQGDMWLFDGKKLAWAPACPERGELRCKVDLDKAERKPGEPVRPGAEFHVVIRKTTEVSLSALRGYLERKIDFSNPVIQALNFVDHLIRQGPSERLLGIKRNFYDFAEKGRPLQNDRIVEVHKGLYASIRLSDNLRTGGAGLALNCDVANTVFWIGGLSMDNVVVNFLGTCDARFQRITPGAELSRALAPVRRSDGNWESSEAFKHLRKLRKLRFKVAHKGRKEVDKVHIAHDFTFDASKGNEGSNARNNRFTWNDETVSIYDYYAKKYQVWLKYPGLPLIETGKRGLMPMELCYIEPQQRYNFKLNPKQTESMIKIAVTRPPQRRSDIEQKIRMLNLNGDKYLNAYGVKFEQGFTQTPARILAAPSVDFKKGQQKPGFSGRWRLDQGDIKFWKPNSCPLKDWGILVMDGCIQNENQLKAFGDKFKSIFIRHGGVSPSAPILINPPGNVRSNGANAVQFAVEKIFKDKGNYPQLLFIVVGQKNSPHYERVKKNADCRFGILSQVVQSSHVVNDAGNSQYISNVCMKVNAKLGGSTSRTVSPHKAATYFPPNRKTMIIGVDVSHAAPGGKTASVAAMTMNCDADANRYAAACETNGYREETVTSSNMQKFFSQLSAVWRKNHGNGFPQHIIYFRDGVAENHFSLILDKEIEEIRRFFRERNIPVPKMTVIIATKRHHIRFFPGPDQRSKGGDRNGNSKPGLIVEREVTHPFLFDFYLNSHVAIQGTARPVHYYVILDEAQCPVNELQRMIYHQCYSYVRSTTPVSIHPAIYYAHLAGSRARFHENIATSEGFRHGGKGHEMLRDKVAKGQSVGPGGSMKGLEAPPLIELGGNVAPEKLNGMRPGEAQIRQFIRETMWFI